MVLRRLGNKSKVVRMTNILDYFPVHDMYIDMFFGAGGMFFSKPKAKYNICNDKDSDVYNLFTILANRRGELEDKVRQTPFHSDLFDHWKTNKETDPMMQAVRFLWLSNFGYMGKQESMRYGFINDKENLIANIERTRRCICDVQFMNADFRDVLGKVSIKQKDKERVFIYADPPYLGTDNNYADNCQFTIKDTRDLVDVLISSGMRFAISEFDNPDVIDIAHGYGLNVNYIGNRVNMKNRRNEILICNYQTRNLFN